MDGLLWRQFDASIAMIARMEISEPDDKLLLALPPYRRPHRDASHSTAAGIYGIGR